MQPHLNSCLQKGQQNRTEQETINNKSNKIDWETQTQKQKELWNGLSKRKIILKRQVVQMSWIRLRGKKVRIQNRKKRREFVDNLTYLNSGKWAKRGERKQWHSSDNLDFFYLRRRTAAWSGQFEDKIRFGLSSSFYLAS